MGETIEDLNKPILCRWKSKIAATLGRVNTKDLHNVYDDKIKDSATICTYKMNSYVRFANSNKINLVQLKSGKSKKGI